MSKFFGKVRGVGPDRLSKSAVSALVVMSHHGSAHSGAPAAIGNVPSFTGAGSPSMVELTSPVAVQPLDERGCLSRDVREAVMSVSSFSHQEVFYLWETFAVLADGNASLSALHFSGLVVQRGLEPVLAEWLFEAFDLNDDRILSFKDWALCIDRTTRGTCRDLTEVALRMLGHSEDQALMRAAQILAQARVALSEEELEKEVAMLIENYERAEGFHFRMLSLKLVQACCELALDFFAGFALEMEARLKRAPPQSVTMVCRKERTLVPAAVRVLCERLQFIEGSEKAKCVDFSADTLYVHRLTVEAVANAFALGYPTVDGLSADILLMVLRTYLRCFTEPLWTLHISRHLMQRCVGLADDGRIALMAQTAPALPKSHRFATYIVLQTAAMLAHDDTSLDTLARILAYVLVRSEPKSSSTSPVAVECVKLSIARFRDIEKAFGC